MWLCAGRQTLICAAWMYKVSFKFFCGKLFAEKRALIYLHF